MALARYRLSWDRYSTRCRLAAVLSRVHVGHDGCASADRMDLHEHEKRVVGAAHAYVFDRFPGHFQRATGDGSARSDVVCPLWNCSMGSRCNRCQEVRKRIGAAESIGAQSDYFSGSTASGKIVGKSETIVVLVDPRHDFQLVGSRRATNCSRSSITEHSFQGIHSLPKRGKSVTHVSGTICYLCVESLTRVQNPFPMHQLGGTAAFGLRAVELAVCCDCCAVSAIFCSNSANWVSEVSAVAVVARSRCRRASTFESPWPCR
jgi:hypothetical protein